VTNYEFFKRLLPENQAAFFVLWWETIHRKPDGKFQHDSSAFRTLLDLANAADHYARALNVRNLYFCVSSQREANFRARGSPPQAIRNIANTVAVKVLFLDLDVKSGAYATTDEAMRALIAVCVAIGLPTPSIVVVYSSAPQDDSPPVDSSLHCYWALNRTLSVEEWRPLARAFKTALQKHGLVFDLNVPSNVAGILRPLGSVNRKYDPPRVARLAFSGPDCDLDAIRAVLAHARPEAEREYSRDRSSDADFDEIVDAVEHLAAHGCFDRGRYEQMLGLHFALAHLVTAKPELRDSAWDLIRCVVAGTGRDLAVNETRFEDALTRTADRLASDGDLVTPASLFRAALQVGWRPPRIEDRLEPEQRHKLYRFRLRLAEMFADGHDRVEAAKRAARMVSRIADERVLAALAPSLARRLALDDWDESTILDAIECATGRRDASLAKWAQRLRRSAA
jgi:hypothetical protein